MAVKKRGIHLKRVSRKREQQSESRGEEFPVLHLKDSRKGKAESDLAREMRVELEETLELLDDVLKNATMPTIEDES